MIKSLLNVLSIFKMGQIYQIINTVNNKSYVGQTTGLTDIRWKYGHVAAARRGSHYPLHCAIRKHSHEQFNVIILEECINELLNSRETFWMLKLQTIVPFGYNLRLGGANGKHSEITKQKISNAKSGKKHNVFSRKNMSAAQTGKKKPKRSLEHCKKLSESHMGKICSKEHRLKIGLSLIGKLRGRKLSIEHKQKLVNAKSHKFRNIQELDFDHNIIAVHCSIAAAARAVQNCSSGTCSNIQNCAKRNENRQLFPNKKRKDGFYTRYNRIWMYLK